jgi:hypothetical protein
MFALTLLSGLSLPHGSHVALAWLLQGSDPQKALAFKRPYISRGLGPHVAITWLCLSHGSGSHKALKPRKALALK